MDKIFQLETEQPNTWLFQKIFNVPFVVAESKIFFPPLIIVRDDALRFCNFFTYTFAVITGQVNNSWFTSHFLTWYIFSKLILGWAFFNTDLIVPFQIIFNTCYQKIDTISLVRDQKSNVIKELFKVEHVFFRAFEISVPMLWAHNTGRF